MKCYKLNDKESKSLLEMAGDSIDRGMVGADYELNSINDMLDHVYDSYGEIKGNLDIEIQVKIKDREHG